MATNPPKGDGKRTGAVRGRSQTQTPSGHYVTHPLAGSWMSKRPIKPRLRAFGRRSSVVFGTNHIVRRCIGDLL